MSKHGRARLPTPPNPTRPRVTNSNQMKKVDVKLTIEQSKMVRKMLRRAEQDIADKCYTASGYDLEEKLARLSQIREIEAKMFYAEQEA